MPWHLPEDLKRFRALTMNHHIIMGRKTWESIGRLLPGRHHVIVSRRAGYTVAGASVVRSLDEALAECAGDGEVFVIGGEQIYRAALPVADRLYVTEVEGDFAGDTFFPEFAPGQWRETIREEHFDDATRNAGFAFVTYERTGSGEPD
jgi:dihydrofolate reductase